MIAGDRLRAMRPSTLVLAHRGITLRGPDNSLAAFKALSDFPVDGLEFDVRITADDVPIATHDPTIAGEAFESSTLARIRQLQGNAVDEDTRIPTLDEALDALPDGITVNLEIKSHRTGHALLDRLAELDSRFDLLVSSFDARPLEQVREAMPGIALGLINSVPLENTLPQLAGYRALSSHWRLVDEDLARQLRDHEVDLYVWTVNGKRDISRMLELGVNAIITDDPGRALELRDG